MDEDVNNNLHDALIDLYLKVKVRSSEEIEQYNTGLMLEEKKELEDTSGIVLIEYIRSNVEILLNIKSEGGQTETNHNKSLNYPEFFSHASSILSQNSKANNTQGYEKVIRKLEKDVRDHIRSEQQLKLYCESLAEKLEVTRHDYTEFRKKHKEKLQQLKLDKKRLEELVALKERELIEVKTTILQHEENALE